MFGSEAPACCIGCICDRVRAASGAQFCRPAPPAVWWMVGARAPLHHEDFMRWRYAHLYAATHKMWKRVVTKKHPLLPTRNSAFWTGVVGVERKRDHSQQAASTSSAAVSRRFVEKRTTCRSQARTWCVTAELTCLRPGKSKRYPSDAAYTAATATTNQRLASSGTPK